MPIKSLSEIRQFFKILYPEQNVRERCLSLLAESIKNAHHYAPDEWIIRYHPHRQIEGFRLMVGNLAIFDIEQKRIWMPLDAELLDATSQYEKLLDKEEGWQWKAGYRSVLKKVLSRNGYYMPDKDPSEKLFSVVLELNSTVIERIGLQNYKLAQRSRQKYEPKIIEFLHRELKQPIPEPGSDLELPEEISEIEALYEGARRRILVNAYERNRIARDKCLRRYGFRCVVCDQCMSEIYGTVAEELIHVHHCKPLSEIQEDYEVDPIKHLRPVCPNCHAVIHRRKPPYKIEEVKDFLEQAKQNG